MSVNSGIKDGWLKHEDDKNNFKKRFVVLQDNVLLFYANEKDIMSKNDIVLSKVTSVLINNHKKSFCFTITTHDSVHTIRAENKDSMNEWINAINGISKIHIIREKYKNKEGNLSESYKHDLITSGKKIIQMGSRVIGITKAVILASKGKLKLSKVSDSVDASEVHANGHKLSVSLVSMIQSILKCVENVYDASFKKVLNDSIDVLKVNCRQMSNYGEGTQNESALFTTLHQILTELDHVQALPIPSPKTDVLHSAQMVSNQMEKLSSVIKEELLASEGNKLIEYSNELLAVTKKIFLLIPDVTYAKPLQDLGNAVPKVTKDVCDLIKKSYHYVVAKTNAMNASKTLHLILNQLREIAKGAFPFEERETLYPPSGPEDTQFKFTSEEEFNEILIRQGFSMDGQNFILNDEGDLPPPPPPEYDEDESNLEEGEMILHDHTKAESIKIKFNHPRTLSEPTEMVYKAEEMKEEDILFELDILLEDANKRSSLQLNDLNKSPGSMPLPRTRKKTGNFTITNAPHFSQINKDNSSPTIMISHISNDSNMNTSPRKNSFQNSYGSSPGSPRNNFSLIENYRNSLNGQTPPTIYGSNPSSLSSSPYQNSIPTENNSEINVVDELDLLLQLQTSKIGTP